LTIEILASEEVYTNLQVVGWSPSASTYLFTALTLIGYGHRHICRR
jgi:hypothetical protein